MVTPMALIHYCEDCGYEGAAFGVHSGGRILSYCGWVDGEPKCIHKNPREAAKTITRYGINANDRDRC